MTAKNDTENTMGSNAVSVESTALFDLIFDVEQKRPACVLLQAAYGCGASPRALRFFPSKSWLVSPTAGMRRIRATEEEWRQIADRFCRSND